MIHWYLRYSRHSVGCADDWKRMIYVMRFVPQHILQHALVAVKNKKLPYFSQY